MFIEFRNVGIILAHIVLTTVSPGAGLIRIRRADSSDINSVEKKGGPDEGGLDVD